MVSYLSIYTQIGTDHSNNITLIKNSPNNIHFRIFAKQMVFFLDWNPKIKIDIRYENK